MAIFRQMSGDTGLVDNGRTGIEFQGADKSAEKVRKWLNFDKLLWKPFCNSSTKAFIYLLSRRLTTDSGGNRTTVGRGQSEIQQANS